MKLKNSVPYDLNNTLLFIRCKPTFRLDLKYGRLQEV